MAGRKPKRTARPGVDEYGRTPLHYAALEGDAPRCRELLEAGADSNAQDDNGWTPLHFAAQAVAEEVATLLLAARANTELRDSFGNTPLFRAVFCSRGKGGVIGLLRQAGADPFAENSSGVSPYKLAHTIGNYDVAQFFADLPGP